MDQPELEKEAMICTASGRRLYPFDPKPGDIMLDDVARGLSNKCRYAGQIPKFYSVAEHSVVVSKWLELNGTTDVNVLLQGLIHDAGEAYFPDRPSPLHHNKPEQFAALREAEARITEMVAVVVSVSWPLTQAVKIADYMVLLHEVNYLMPRTDWWGLQRIAIARQHVNDAPLLFQYTPEAAYRIWWDRLHELLPEITFAVLSQ